MPFAIVEALESATRQLAFLDQQALIQQLEPIRVSRVSYALVFAGCSRNATFPGHVVGSHLKAFQKRDGGWADVEETLWCLGYLAAFDDMYEVQTNNGTKYLHSVRLPCGAWGRSERDQPRIPTTALASALVPAVVGSSGLEWLANQWEADLASATQLTYKGAFFLLSQTHKEAPEATDLVEKTIAYLCSEQETDGGFSPWKGHPVGSDPWTTGIVLWGLSRFPQMASRDVIKRAVNWLQSKQLPNGFWPYHYLDDGTAMALIGLSSVLPLMRE